MKEKVSAEQIKTSTTKEKVVKSGTAKEKTPAIKTETIVRYSDEELEEFKALINARLEVSRKELQFLQEQMRGKDDKGLQSATDRHLTIEDGSAAMELEQVAQLVGRQIQYINNLENALLRIMNRTYGVCRVTGKLIDKARLRAVPHATLSIEAKLNKN